MTESALSIKDLTVDLKTFKLDQINLEVPAGTIVGIVGRNGAGKTTLIRSICGIYNYKSGDVRINQVSLKEDEVKYLEQLGVMTEQGIFNPYFTPNRIRKIFKRTYPKFDASFFDLNMDKFDIEKTKRIIKMSTGNQKKMNLIAVMSLKPDMLILDEPTANIDPISKIDVVELLQSYLEDEKKTIFFSTHQTELLDKIADYILILEKGKVLISGLKDELIEKHVVVQVSKESFDVYKSYFIGYKKSALGYEGLILKSDLKTFDKIDYLLPTIEDLLFYYVEGSRR